LKRKKYDAKARRAKPKQVKRSLEFQIESMDSMGQGVAKIDNKPCFIPKTLPGERGQAALTKASKGVMFARLSTLDITADNREEPLCEHFDSCPGCHYLHTDYDSELHYKQQALEHHLRRLETDVPDIEVSPAGERLGYRNRIQLHYRHKYIGMMDGVTNNVVEIPECLALDKSLKTAFDNLYKDKSWTADHEGQGHCELYLAEEGVGVEWDQPYAHGGFSQVNDTMNTVLKAAVCTEAKLDQAKENEVESLLDLFSGEGNLSDLIIEGNPSIERVMVDYAPDRVNQEVLNFVHLDLFSDTALRTFKARSEYQKFDVLLVDPPRKGFADLALWVKAFKPKKLIYVSCNAATMVRDLQQLTGKHSIDHVGLIDLFPGTYHYETLVTVSFN
jgi:23S rRNA (uracil1939-C5)-methyltransferase